MHGAETDGRVAASACTIAIDDLPDGLIVTDRFGRVLAVNRAAARLTGVAEERAIGRDMNEVFPFRDHDGREWWKALDPEGGLRTRSRVPERPLHLPGGQELYVAARLVREPQRCGEVE
ncbi:PAS domain-containing protein, partial [Nonomuraea sp. NPDC005983]|uniref:PAS domain-containing protein n=1 Tax=Nonomuraea sp. NPDC005983 TaxID=3155595 RepID=UPI0033A06F9F